MNVTSVGSTMSAQHVSNTRAADGDYKIKNASTSQTKDSDGDYKRVAPSAPAAASGSAAVQNALLSLKKGGA